MAGRQGPNNATPPAEQRAPCNGHGGRLQPQSRHLEGSKGLLGARPPLAHAQLVVQASQLLRNRVDQAVASL